MNTLAEPGSRPRTTPLRAEAVPDPIAVFAISRAGPAHQGYGGSPLRARTAELECGPHLTEGVCVVLAVRTHRRCQGQVLGGGLVVTGAGEGQAEAEGRGGGG